MTTITLAAGTYYFKDRNRFVLVYDGERCGDVAARAEAKTWLARELRAETLLFRSTLRAAKGHHYADLQAR